MKKRGAGIMTSRRALQKKATEARSWLQEAQARVEDATFQLQFCIWYLHRFVKGEDTTIGYLKECERLLQDKTDEAQKRLGYAIRTRDWADQVASGTEQRFLPEFEEEE